MTRISDKLGQFRTRIRDCCEERIGAGRYPVASLIEEIAPWIDTEPRVQARQYRVFRDLVEDAAREGEPRSYAMMVAVHDALLRNGVFVPPGGDLDYLMFFDEAFYREQYPDVVASIQGGAFRDGFHHFHDNGAAEGRIAHRWRAVGRTVALEGSSDWGRLLDSSTTEAAEAGVEVEGFGINVIGFHSANLGLGVAARNYTRFFEAAGLEVCPVELPVPGGRSGHDVSYEHRFAPLDKPAPHNVNLFVMNPRDIADQFDRDYAAVQSAGRINIALPFWELPRLPRAWVPILNDLDVVIAASGFIKYMMLMDASGPSVRDLGLPMYMPDDVAPDRERFGIAPDVVTFVSSFEMASDINRKNPFAAIEAFEQAFAGDDSACLIVKVNNSKREPEFKPHLERLDAIAKRCPNVRLMEEVLSYRDVMSLFASCDVFVSLHRAEGFGLCLMEMMTLGKPVIATAWSGNMSFTDEQNSCLVGYDLVPVQSATQKVYSAAMLGEEARWADARVDEAAHWMRRLVDDPELRRQIGRRAAAAMVEYQKRIDVRELVATVRNLAERRGIELH